MISAANPSSRSFVTGAAAVFLAGALSVIPTVGATQTMAANVLPRPAAAAVWPGQDFRIPATLPIVLSHRAAPLREVAEMLAGSLRARTGVSTTVVSSVPDGAVAIRLDTTLDSGNAEDYTLAVTAREIRIIGSSSAGVRWGAQSLLQMLDRDADTLVRGALVRGLSGQET